MQITMKFMALFSLTVGASAVRAAVPQQRQGLTRNPAWAPLRTESQAEVVSDGSTGLRAGASAGAAKRADKMVPTWKAGLYAGLALVGGIALGGAVCYLVAAKKKQAEEPLVEDAGEAPLASGRSEGAGSAAAGSAADGSAVPEPEPQTQSADYERLLRALSQRVAQKVGPKLAKGQAVRGIIEERVMTIKEKAKAFFLNELNTTAGQLLKAIEAEEAMLLLDWNNAVASNFPPISVLLAGLLSPTLLSLRQLAHMLQLVVGLLPILALCIWATIRDYNTVCAIPTIFAWVYVQGGLALILSFAHLMVYLKISSGKKILTAKAEAMNEKLQAANAGSSSAEEMGLSEMRELFVCSTVLLQQALLVEDGVRNSIWHKITGAGSLLWMVTTIWNFVIVMGWTFMPGIIAFHPKAASVAAEAYCGALITVLSARVICVLHLLFMGINVMTVVTWISDVMTSSPSFGQGVLKQAEKLDKGILGVPVIQTLVKAFLLRGGMDLSSSQLAVAVNERANLEKEREKAQYRLNEVDSQLAACKAVEEALQAKAGKDTSSDLEASISQLENLGDTDMNAWKEKGAAAIADLQVQATALEEATTKDIEVIMQKITEAAEAIQSSEGYQSAMAKASAAAELAQQKAGEVHGQLAEQMTAENLQSVMAQAQQAASAGMSRAQEVAGQLAETDAVKQAQASASDAVKQAQALASQATAEFSKKGGL